MSSSFRVRFIRDEGVELGNEVFAPLALTTDEDVFNMGVDGSSAEKRFQYVVPAGKVFCWYRFTLKLLDGDISDLSEWGADVGRLDAANALYVHVVNASDVEVEDFGTKTKEPLRGIGDLSLLAGVDIDPITDVGPGLDLGAVRWTLRKGLGQPLLIPAGFKIQVVIRGDMSGANELTSMVQGTLRDA